MCQMERWAIELYLRFLNDLKRSTVNYFSGGAGPTEVLPILYPTDLHCDELNERPLLNILTDVAPRRPSIIINMSLSTICCDPFFSGYKGSFRPKGRHIWATA